MVDNNGQRQKIRMIGLDTPESVDRRKPVQCFAQEASAHAKTVLAGQLVYLETDPLQDSVDRYGRRLAYVWTESGRLLNLDMIADGYAHEYTYDLDADGEPTRTHHPEFESALTPWVESIAAGDEVMIHRWRLPDSQSERDAGLPGDYLTLSSDDVQRPYR